MSFPTLDEIKERAKTRIDEMRGRFQMQRGVNSQVGSGQLMNRIQAKVSQARARVQTRMQTRQMPGRAMLPRRPITTRRQPFRGDVTSLPVPTQSGKGFQVAEEPGGIYQPEISIER